MFVELEKCSKRWWWNECMHKSESLHNSDRFRVRTAFFVVVAPCSCCCSCRTNRYDCIHARFRFLRLRSAFDRNPKNWTKHATNRNNENALARIGHFGHFSYDLYWPNKHICTHHRSVRCCAPLATWYREHTQHSTGTQATEAERIPAALQTRADCRNALRRPSTALCVLGPCQFVRLFCGRMPRKFVYIEFAIRLCCVIFGDEQAARCGWLHIILCPNRRSHCFRCFFSGWCCWLLRMFGPQFIFLLLSTIWLSNACVKAICEDPSIHPIEGLHAP